MAQPDYDNDLVFPPQNFEELQELKEQVEDLRKDLKSAIWYQAVQNESINNLRKILRECREYIDSTPVEDSYSDRYDLLTRINVVIDEEK